MKLYQHFCVRLVFIQLLFHICISVSSQTGSPPITLFAADEILNITLKGSLRNLLNDRTEVPKKFPVTLAYIKEDNTEMTIPVQMSTRGHFRRMKENCSYPPLSIQFAKDGVHKNSVFSEQKKMKLVMPCRGDEYIIRELLTYKIYNLITPLSFKARLVKVKLEDTKNNKTSAPFYGLLLEEEKQMAKRNKMIAVEKKMQPQQAQPIPFLTMAVFQYLIGNTDWSIQFQQNIKQQSLTRYRFWCSCRSASKNNVGYVLRCDYHIRQPINITRRIHRYIK